MCSRWWIRAIRTEYMCETPDFGRGRGRGVPGTCRNHFLPHHLELPSCQVCVFSIPQGNFRPWTWEELTTVLVAVSFSSPSSSLCSTGDQDYFTLPEWRLGQHQGAPPGPAPSRDSSDHSKSYLRPFTASVSGKTSKSQTAQDWKASHWQRNG